MIIIAIIIRKNELFTTCKYFLLTMNEKYQHLMKPNVGGILIQYRRHSSLSSAKNLCKVNIDIIVKCVHIISLIMPLNTQTGMNQQLYAYLFHAWW